MPKTQLDRILGRKPSLRRKILLEFAQSPSGVADRVLADNCGVDHSDFKKQHLHLLEECGLIVKCEDVLATRGIGRKKTPTELYLKAHGLNCDIANIITLMDVFSDSDECNDFFVSPGFRDMVSAVPGEFDRTMPFWRCTISVGCGIIPLCKRLSPQAVIDAIQNVDELFEGGNNAIICAIATIGGHDQTIKPKDRYHLRDDENEAIKQMKRNYLKRDRSKRDDDYDDVFLVLKPRLSDATITHLKRHLVSDRQTLRAILRYIFADYEKRDATYQRIARDANDPELSHVAAVDHERNTLLYGEEYRECGWMCWRDVEVVDLHDAIYYNEGIDWIRCFNWCDHRYHHSIESF